MQKLRQLSKILFRGHKRLFASYPSCSEELRLNRVLILKKRTRFELEKLNIKETDSGLIDHLKRRGSDVDAILNTYKVHEKLSNALHKAFQDAGFEVNVIDRTQFTTEAIDWADIIVTAGGDGTFLIGASEIKSRNKPLLGFNTNPHKSTGYLCLPTSIDYEYAVRRLRLKEFQWRFRTRIEVMLTGQSADDSPERIGLHSHSQDDGPCLTNRCNPITSRILPSKALNEVFIAEKRPSQVSNFIVHVPGVPKTHVKCSGVCVSTGTGSTSWQMSMNRLSFNQVYRLFKIAKLNFSADELVKISSGFNSSLQFPYDDPRMFYTVRDLIYSPITPDPIGLPSEAFTPTITITSKCFSASVVIDGTHAWSFNDGTIAKLTTNPDIALRTVHFD